MNRLKFTRIETGLCQRDYVEALEVGQDSGVWEWIRAVTAERKLGGQREKGRCEDESKSQIQGGQSQQTWVSLRSRESERGPDSSPRASEGTSSADTWVLLW